MKVSMLTACPEVLGLRAQIKALTADYERANGAVQTIDIIKRSETPANWNGTIVPEKKVNQGVANSAINKIISQRYATEPCLKALALELGVSVASVSKRAGRLGITRNKETKIKNNPVTLRGVARLKKAAVLFDSGASIATVSKKLDVSERAARHYRQQIELAQEAA